MSRREAEESTYGDATMPPHPPQQIDRQVRVNSRQLERGRGRSSWEERGQVPEVCRCSVESAPSRLRQKGLEAKIEN